MRSNASLIALACGLSAMSSHALAQSEVIATAPKPASPSPVDAAPSENLAVNLLELLVRQGVVSRTAADQLRRQAEIETAAAKALAAATPSQAIITLPAPAAGTVRVPYVPEVVRNQIRDDIRSDVIKQAKDEGWAAPGAVPNWLSRITISGDMRLRDQFNLYSRNNTGEYVDYAAFNAKGPTDINPDTNPNGLPFRNTRNSQNNILSIQARLAIDAKLSDYLGVGLRLATGDSNGPVSTTGTLNGGLAKQNIWLDQGYIWLRPQSGMMITAGRVPDPFLTTYMMFADDLNFDGVTARVDYKPPLADTRLSFLGAAFPLNYQDVNFPSKSSLKAGFRAKWLFAAQIVADVNKPQWDWKTGVALYDYNDVRGQLSTACALYNGNNQCSTDFTAPEFMQKGNTLFFIRNISPNPSTPLDYAQPQLLGLRFGYTLADLTTKFDYRIGFSKHLIFTGEYTHNFAYNRADACRSAPTSLPVNNLIASALGNTDPCNTPAAGDTKAVFQSGPNAWSVRLLYGDPQAVSFGQWNIEAGYSYIEPDALLDGFNSPDFHLGGTNAQGYIVSASYGLFYGAWLQARWFSANEIFGPPLAIDVLQLELHVRF